MNPKLVNKAADVIQASMARGNREALSFAFDLEAAGLLQSPESAAELTALRNGALNTPMSEQRLAEILARAAAATPGPWCTDAWEIYQGTEYEPGLSAWIGETCRGTSTPEQDRADASFVAAARTDVPELVAAVQLLTAEVDKLRARVAELEAQRAAVLALHRKYTDSNHCFADDETWPCNTRTTLNPAAAPVEDPHDSPLHHAYQLGRDLDRAVEDLAAEGAEAALLAKIFGPDEGTRVPGSCDACGDAPSAWCPDCGACRKGCHNGHDGSCTHPNAPWGGAS